VEFVEPVEFVEFKAAELRAPLDLGVMMSPLTCVPSLVVTPLVVSPPL